MLQVPKLRVCVMPHRNRIAAWFPDQPLDGKLFVGNDTRLTVQYMYGRRLRKLTQRLR
ncbi:BcepNY3gp64 [Burkholderia phage BcepNY3]|uniref:BcepNY3gp64 n=1 Tax=Burkholderia phage BcepNY3 TaxID=2881397 RepID=A6N3H2_9CAUD|nr:BcepNY3gp64 [Burkholderia phage BcepNY3]ABR10599.1 BcepNY3gp64 [Burkholderia phage BcepNY3]